MAPNLFERRPDSIVHPPRDLTEMGRMLDDEGNLKLENSMGSRRPVSKSDSSELSIRRKPESLKGKQDESEELPMDLSIGL